jgi:hypothetical protein
MKKSIVVAFVLLGLGGFATQDRRGQDGRKGKEEPPPGAVQGAPASDILSRTAIKLVVK